MAEKVYLFDSTLRDGEQTPGARLNHNEKIKIARQLAKLNVDVIEAGFPISSPGDLKAVQEISREVKGPIVCALARTVLEDIDVAWESVKEAENPRLHVFLGASDIHMEKKLKRSPEKLMEEAVEAVKYAKSFTEDVEYSLEDATRARHEYMYRVIEAVIKAGATVVNLPDTVGYGVPYEYGQLFKNVRENVPVTDRVILSTHCHNDLGMAVSNSLAAVENGARQIECNINGIGERAGNASLEEIAVAMRIRKDFYPYYSDINFQEIYRTSKLVSKLTGISIPVNKAIVGKNAFAHSSGIHQDGVLKNKQTYEIIDAEFIGGKAAQMMLTARSGRHALRHQLEDIGYKISDEECDDIYHRFLDLADKKKEVFPEDLEALIYDHFHLSFTEPTYHLDYLQTVSGSKSIPAAILRLTKGDERFEEVATGSGPIDAAYNAINKIIDLNVKLENYQLNAITEGRDALGEVSVKLTCQSKSINGRGVSTDIIEASVKAYLNGINKLLKINHLNQHAD